jgi:hypothetical protein
MTIRVPVAVLALSLTFPLSACGGGDAAAEMHPDVIAAASATPGGARASASERPSPDPFNSAVGNAQMDCLGKYLSEGTYDYSAPKSGRFKPPRNPDTPEAIARRYGARAEPHVLGWSSTTPPVVTYTFDRPRAKARKARVDFINAGGDALIAVLMLSRTAGQWLVESDMFCAR